MNRRSDEDIQDFVDQGGSLAQAHNWEQEELLDLRAYALIDEVLGEEPEFTLPPDFADRVTDRLMPKAAALGEKFILAAVLSAFAIGSAIMVIGSVPLAVAGGGRVVATLAVHGRPDIVLGVTALLAGIALLDRALTSLVWRSSGSSPRNPARG